MQTKAARDLTPGDRIMLVHPFKGERRAFDVVATNPDYTVPQFGRPLVRAIVKVVTGPRFSPFTEARIWEQDSPLEIVSYN